MADMGNMDMGHMDDEPEEEVMEDMLEGICYQPSKNELVNEVAKRVARHLAEAKQAERKMNEALSRRTILLDSITVSCYINKERYCPLLFYPMEELCSNYKKVLRKSENSEENQRRKVRRIRRRKSSGELMLLLSC